MWIQLLWIQYFALAQALDGCDGIPVWSLGDLHRWSGKHLEIE